MDDHAPLPTPEPSGRVKAVLDLLERNGLRSTAQKHVSAVDLGLLALLVAHQPDKAVHAEAKQELGRKLAAQRARRPALWQIR